MYYRKLFFDGCEDDLVTILGLLLTLQTSAFLPLYVEICNLFKSDITSRRPVLVKKVSQYSFSVLKYKVIP